MTEKPVPSHPAGTLVAPVTNIDRQSRPADLVRHVFMTPQIEGVRPFVHSLSVDASVAPVDILPEGAVIQRSVTNDTSVIALAECAEGSILISAAPREAIVTVSAATESDARALIRRIRERLPAKGCGNTVAVRTWHLSTSGHPSASDRRIDAPAWADIGANYLANVLAQLERLVRVARPTGTARLVLWHGEPGTGKTTAVRALLREWEPWCAAQYIADPEQLFRLPAYISEVLTRSPNPRMGPTLDRPAEPEAMWRLIVAEDSDEYLRASARRDAGVGLGRLLNLADGVR